MRRIATSLVILILVQNITLATVRFPSCLTSNMVLQQQSTVAIWGTATPDHSISLVSSWNNKHYKTSTNHQGKWVIYITTPGYGGPYNISVSDGTPNVLQNILIGEVWFCSGQSNMEMPLAGWGKINNYEEEIAAADYPAIRLLQVTQQAGMQPNESADVEQEGWQVCNPTTISNFSSTAYFFARELYRKLRIPVGLIHSSWGGTPVTSWMSGKELKKIPAYRDAISELEKGTFADNELTYLARLQAWNNLIDEKDTGLIQNFTQNPTPSPAWKTIQVPGNWEDQSLPGFDGTVWYLNKINIPADWTGKDATLLLGTIDDDDVTWFNGNLVGQTNGWDKQRKYNIPSNFLKPGENTLLIRVRDEVNGGGINGKDNIPRLINSSGDSIKLAGKWNYHVGMNLNSVPPKPISPASPFQPSVLFNGMVHPFRNYTIRGVIWYQGEANVSDAEQYRKLFPMLINNWRQQWKRNDLPFYFVQLANYLQKDPDPQSSPWAELREAQRITTLLPHTGMAVTIDIGDSHDIHPKNKQEVGRRLALIALAKTYHYKTNYQGPVFTYKKTEGSQIRIGFLADSLITSTGGSVLGFTIAGADRKFYAATATIHGKEVVVSHPDVPRPVAVRYGWANNPDVNLASSDGLPASPFKTDDWQH